MVRSGVRSLATSVVDAASAASEVAARAHASQRGDVRPPRTILQSAKSGEFVRPSQTSSAQRLQTLATPHEPTLNAERAEAENPTPNSSYMHIDSALPLTLRQLDVLRSIEQWIDARGWPPSLSELCAELGTSSKAVVVDHLKGLERKGYLRRDAGERRGLRVLIPSTQARVVEPRPIRKAVHLCDRCRREVG